MSDSLRPETVQPAVPRWLAWGLGGLVLVVLILIVLDELEDAPSTGADQDAAPPAVAVQVEAVRQGPLTQWLFAEGIAQAERKEFLQFERAGQVTFIATDASGKTLREGSRVAGPQGDSQLGQLIARLDERETAAQVAQVDAELAAARTRVTAALAAQAQALQD